MAWIGLCSASEVLAQPLIEGFNSPFNNEQITSITRLSAAQETPGSTEVKVNFSYTYSGRNGPTATVYIVPVSREFPQAGLWFGSDPFTISQGRGVGSIEISYFQDEPGAPVVFNTDAFRALIVENGGRGVIADLNFTKRVQWGKPGDKKAELSVEPAPLLSQPDGEDQELMKRRQEVEAERLRLEQERLAAEEEARKRREAEKLAKKQVAIQEVARLQALEIAKRIQQEQQAREEAARLAKLEEERKAREEAARLAKLEEERKAREEAARLAKLEEERKAREEAARLAKVEEERRKLLELLAVAESSAAEMQKELADSRMKSEQAASEAAEAEKLANELKSAKAKVDDEAKVIAKASAQEAARTVPMLLEPQPGQFKTQVRHVDVVNRSRDRTSMTIGVEFEMRDQLDSPAMGVRVTRKDEPRAFQLFESDPEPIGRSRRNFLLLPVRFNPSLFPSAESLAQYATDQVQVYMTPNPDFSDKYRLFDTTMLLHWESEANSKVTEIQRINDDYLEIDTFKKNDLHQGYVSIRYRLKSDNSGKIIVALFDSKNPATRSWIDTDIRYISGDVGLEVLNFSVSPDADPPSGNLFDLDTILIQLLDSNDQVIAEIRKQTPMTWALVK